MDADCKCEYKTERNQLFTRLKTLEAEIENLKKLVGQQGAPGYGAQMAAPTPPTMQMMAPQPSPMRGKSYAI